ncbi:hypothetical protein TNIN_225021 [Trichonephila inaurata madagascariensis]|uniref:Uncharacterized protein n=1 Tax=Trichonephila inaurata madagascariensis TaxID=2747483 RepID=A0A8X6WPE6_9ARAC|nr:hypothetical protein TNIN_225021 [Trichonephila inaurata madagascariensis]
MGCQPPSIHRRYPLLHAGSFCLLSFFRPGPEFAPSLDSLVFPSSLKRTISTPCLACGRPIDAEQRRTELPTSRRQQPCRPPERLDYKTTPPDYDSARAD